MINEVRSYFKARIKQVNSDLVEHDNPFNDQIAESIIDDVYLIKIGQIQSSFVNQTIEDTMPIQIVIYRHGENDILENYYDFYQEAHLIRLCCVDPKFSRNGGYIKNVICESFQGLQKDDNDNIIVYTLDFKVTLSFGLTYS